jgi:hypothetical protein
MKVKVGRGERRAALEQIIRTLAVDGRPCRIECDRLERNKWQVAVWHYNHGQNGQGNHVPFFLRTWVGLDCIYIFKQAARGYNRKRPEDAKRHRIKTWVNKRGTPFTQEIIEQELGVSRPTISHTLYRYYRDTLSFTTQRSHEGGRQRLYFPLSWTPVQIKEYKEKLRAES